MSSNRRKMTLEEIMEKDYYKGILKLLFYFQNKENGLRPMHFKYILMEKPIFSKNPQKQEEKIKKFEKFFDMDEKLWWELKGFVKGCVKSEQKLSNYLRTLVRRELIEEHRKKNVVHYNLSENYIDKILKSDLKKDLDGYKSDDKIRDRYFSRLLSGTHDTSHDFIEYGLTNWTLFGFSPEEINTLTINEKNVLKECLENVELNLNKILDLHLIKKEKRRDQVTNLCFTYHFQKWF